MRALAAVFLLSSALAPALHAQKGAPNGEWPHFGGDLGNTKYSPLEQIDASNFERLEIVWRWESISRAVVEANPSVRPGQFKPTPLMFGGRIYVATAIAQVAAIDAGSGETLWTYDPKSYEAGRPANVGFQHRGVASWRDGKKGRIFLATHDRRLVALDAATGKTFPEFGDGGEVDLEHNLGREVNPRHLTHSSPPVVCRDTVVVGSIVHDGPTRLEAPPGHVRGFDARSGKLRWIFHTIPQQGEVGNDTWEDDAWRVTGAVNVWTMMSADEELGLVYLPTSTPTNDFYGGHRLGDNLFAESLVAVDCRTGERAWHFQAVHHGLWDYDFPTAPTLFDLEEADGSIFRGIAVPSKQAFLYVFDRATGKPRWPIEERAVPQTDVPGERTSPTQPFPTRPAPYDRHGVTEDALIDFSPELRAEAKKILDAYTWGPIFTPPVVASEKAQGTITVPGSSGGSMWPGAALDPETSRIFLPSITNPMVTALAKGDPNRVEFDYMLRGFAVAAGPRGLPLLKPPYGRITAIDLESGNHAWMLPHGNGPRQKVIDLGLPDPGPLGSHGSGPVGGGGPLVTKTLLIVGQGTLPTDIGVDAIPKLNVFDKATGQKLGHLELPANPYGNPITYLHRGRQFLAVAIGGGSLFGGGRQKAEVIAFALPRSERSSGP